MKFLIEYIHEKNKFKNKKTRIELVIGKPPENSGEKLRKTTLAIEKISKIKRNEDHRLIESDQIK